jgi:hypothetical protein
LIRHPAVCLLNQTSPLLATEELSQATPNRGRAKPHVNGLKALNSVHQQSSGLVLVRSKCGNARQN